MSRYVGREHTARTAHVMSLTCRVSCRVSCLRPLLLCSSPPCYGATGEYCWFWGDFFFRKDMTLTFDGIFELFPHPMYTVGYIMYYGVAMVSRSYTVFFVSLFAHLLQFGFLAWVEEPHIQRTYGSPQAHTDSSAQSVLY